VRLDDPAGTYVPQLREAGSPLANVTLRELLSHSSGVIRDGSDANYWAHARPFPDDAELLDILLTEGVVREPQATFKYSNIAYSLAGLVIGAAGGGTYNDVVTREVIEPLGLADTTPEYNAARADDYAGAHTGLHSLEKRQVIPHVDTRAMSAATGFSSTAEDMVVFGSGHFYGDTRLISDRSKAEMSRPNWFEITPGAPDDAYGLGIYTAKYDHHKVWGHSGGYPGHITRTFWDPYEGIAVSVLTNAVDGPAEELAGNILRILDLARKADGTRALTSGLKNTLALDTEGDESIDLARFTGRFAAMWGVTDVAVIGGKLVGMTPVGPNPVVMTSSYAVLDEDTLRITGGSNYGSVGELVRYERNVDGAIVRVTFGGMTMEPIERWRAKHGE
jgi:CubicO group peptidase (beta-lactamase class C family)